MRQGRACLGVVGVHGGLRGGADGDRLVQLALAAPRDDDQRADMVFAHQRGCLGERGMGVDGHFASLFPGAATLATALDLHQTRSAIEILPNPMPAAGPFPRISLSLSRLLRSDRLLLVITGHDKLAVIERARSGERSLPVTSLLAAHHPAAEIHWSP